ncbi:MAG: GUN4 domain-containing protein [Dolichospermum sp. DEX189]|nr:GUN4 domain-containing protein [Dolichospermum sp. DEX189]
MVAPALDYNPRRWKQFINVFRLKAYIGASTNLITAHVSENNSRRYLTLEQLGKFTAISIRWPRLIMDLNTDRQLLKHLQKGALEHSADFSEYNETTKYWGSKPKLVELLRYAAVGSIEKYSFANVDVETLLQVSPTDDLSSERDIDYTKLRDLLKAGNWKEADKETYEVMIKAVGKKSGEWFTDNELLNFPCQDLRTIDKLWVKYSRLRFGFSVQKEIYLSVGGKADGEYHRDAWEKFGNKVGWRENEGWIDYSQVKFSTSAVDGHLPFLFELWWWGEYGGVLAWQVVCEGVWVSSLASRLVNCNI